MPCCLPAASPWGGSPIRVADAEPRCTYPGGCALVAACADPCPAPPPLSCQTGLGFHQIRRPVICWPPGRAACGVAPGARNGPRSQLAVMSLRNLEGAGPSLRGRRPGGVFCFSGFPVLVYAAIAGAVIPAICLIPETVTGVCDVVD